MALPLRSRLVLVSWILLVISAGMYALSLTMHVAAVHRAFKVFGIGPESTESMKLLSTIRTLYEEGDVGLAVVIAAFTLLFPIGKYLALGFVLLAHSAAARHRVLLWIKNLGQWSMGDVFVVALLVVVIRVNNSVAQIQVDVLPGLWVFAGSVVLSMIVSALLGFHAAREADLSIPLGTRPAKERTVRSPRVPASDSVRSER